MKERPKELSAQEYPVQRIPINLTITGVSTFVAKTLSPDVPQIGLPIMPEGFTTETGLLPSQQAVGFNLG